jgi:hypothetical protein
MSALDKQEGGDHYKTMKIEPVEFCQRNGLNFCESSAIKYICRHKRKNGVEDIRKAIHFLELLLQLEYDATKETEPPAMKSKFDEAAQLDDHEWILAAHGKTAIEEWVVKKYGKCNDPKCACQIEQFTTADGGVGYQVRNEVCK